MAQLHLFNLSLLLFLISLSVFPSTTDAQTSFTNRELKIIRKTVRKGITDQCDCYLGRAFETFNTNNITAETRTIDGEEVDVFCHSYIVARTEEPETTCLEQDLDHIVISVDTDQYCPGIDASVYRSMIVDTDCSCQYGSGSSCCSAVEIGVDAKTSELGVSYYFAEPILEDEDAVVVSMCVKGASEQVPGLVTYYAVGTYGYTCDAYEVPAFCQGMF